MENKNIIIGYDLGSRFSKICWYNGQEKTAENVLFGEEQMQIPTALCKISDNIWLCGQEAVDAANNDRGILLDDFIDDYEEQPEIHVGVESYEKKSLIAIYLRESLKVFKHIFDDYDIAYMTISLRQISKTIMNDITGNSEFFGVNKNCVRVQSYIASYEYYALNQKKELWSHDVGLFEYDEDGLNYYHLYISKKRQPTVVNAQVYPLKMYMNGEMLENESPIDLDRKFADVLNQVLAQKLISTIYLTGKGFTMSWLNDAKRRLCSGRKVFFEESVYAAGACYCSQIDVSGRQFKQFIALNDDIVPVSIYLKGSRNKEIVRRELVTGGSFWYNLENHDRFILDGTDTVVFRVRDLVTDTETLIPLKLEGLPDRENKTTTVGVEVSFESARICNFIMTDEGFGSVYPPSGTVWKRRINVAEYEGDKKFSEQGRLMFQRELPEKVPYYFSVSNTKVYSLEELCYYIYNNIYAVSQETFNEELFYWIGKTLQEEPLAKDLSNLKKNEASLKTMVLRLMDYADYYRNDECAQLGLLMDEIVRQNPLETKKIQADNLIRYGRYMEAIAAYTAVAGKLENDEEMTAQFKGSVYHNLSAAYMRVMNFESAAAGFRHAYDLNKNPDSLKCCLWALKMGNDESAFFDIAGKYHLPEKFIEELIEEYDITEAGIEASPRPDDQDALKMLAELKSIYRG